MKYNFIEIGSGKFSEYMNYANEQTKGILVEPNQEYLNSLPNKQGVQKVLGVVTDNDSVTSVDVYSIPEQIMSEYSLDPFLKTLHGIGAVHQDHINWQVDYLVEKVSVPTMTLAKIFQDYMVEGVLVLKVAAASFNTEIIDHFENWLKLQNSSVFPRKIQFVNESSQKQTLVDSVLSKYQQLGYTIYSQQPEKIELVFKP